MAFGIIQGTFGIIQGTFGIIQGTFGIIQGTFSEYSVLMEAVHPRGPEPTGVLPHVTIARL
jgi:hypothetical protein